MSNSYKITSREDVRAAIQMKLECPDCLDVFYITSSYISDGASFECPSCKGEIFIDMLFTEAEPEEEEPDENI